MVEFLQTVGSGFIPALVFGGYLMISLFGGIIVGRLIGEVFVIIMRGGKRNERNN